MDKVACTAGTERATAAVASSGSRTPLAYKQLAVRTTHKMTNCGEGLRPRMTSRGEGLRSRGRAVADTLRFTGDPGCNRHLGEQSRTNRAGPGLTFEARGATLIV